VPSDTESSLSNTQQSSLLSKVSPDKIRNFLIENPEFILNDADFLRRLLSSIQREDKKIVNFQGALIDLLEKRLLQLSSAHKEVIDAACDNMESIFQIHCAVLEIIGTQDLTGFLDTLNAKWKNLLGVDAVVLVLDSNLVDQKAKINTDIQSAIPNQPDLHSHSTLVKVQVGGVIALLKEKSVLKEKSTSDSDNLATPILRESIRGDGIFYANIANTIRSEAIVPLTICSTVPDGLLIFGSGNEKRFQKNQAVDLLMFLGASAALTLNRLYV
jgi:uncharacterized protein YigA (DUF484 family)